MIPGEFSAFWNNLSTGLANHLWQSTLFAVAAGLLTLALRQNQARARYWIWLAASVKFLIPFAPLIAIGKELAWFRGGSAVQPSLSVTIEELGRPFTRPMAATVSASAAAQVHTSASSALFPSALFLIWIAGFLAVVAIWCVRWRRISDAIRQSISMHDGIEVETLRRVEQAAAMKTRLEILSSPTTLEPGIFGIVRPVLLWPEGISRRLTPNHLEAALVHELCHVRRRDNLAAALHMLVEALFWFHPLVWWLGARLIDERERACDEQVLEFGSQREVYAESILKVCEFCIGSPLACVAGITGSDLKKRMVHIMSEHIGRKLDFNRKLLITTAAALAIAVPVIFGVLDATPTRAQSSDAATTPTFKSFSITPSDTSSPRPNPLLGSTHMMRMMYGPDSFVASNVTLQALIQEAYGVQANQISGPSDILNATYDVAAKVDSSSGAKFGMINDDRTQSQRMLQAALAEHTRLVLHHETKVLPVYALVVAESGPKLQASAADGPALSMRLDQMPAGNREVVDSAQKVPIDELARQLSHHLGVTVFDKTGLKGNYDFNLKWTENSSQPPDATETSAAADDPAASNSSLFEGLQQQLGLKLEPQKQPMDILVIDHIEKPNEN